MSTPANALDITQAGLVKFDGVNIFSGVTTTQYATLVGAANNGITSVANGTTGQVLTANTGADPSYQDLPASSSFTWNEVTGTSQSAAVANGYITNNAGAVTVTLPGTFAVGDVIRVAGKGAGGWIIQAPAGDTIRLGDTVSSSGGTFTSTNAFDCVELVGTTADTAWLAISSVGNITIA